MKTAPRLVHGWNFALPLASVFLAQAATFAADAPPPPPLATIIREVVARDDANQKALQSMEYHEVLKTERLNGRGQVTKQQELRMIVRPGAAEDVKVLSDKGPRIPTDPDQAALQARGRQAQKQNMSFALKDMANRFNIAYVGTDLVLGQPVYVVAFEPRPNQPYRDQTEKVLNHLHGRMWISARDYSVLKTEATLAQPVQIAWIFAQVSALEFQYNLNDTSGGMGPSIIRIFVQVHAPFIDIRQRTTVEMTGFQPRGKAWK